MIKWLSFLWLKATHATLPFVIIVGRLVPLRAWPLCNSVFLRLENLERKK